MDSKERLRILEKIRKCFALAGSNNPHEAAQAIKQAYALMKKHGIDECIADIGEIKQGENMSYSNTKSSSAWLDYLLAIIQRVFDITAIGTVSQSHTKQWNKKTNNRIKLIGHPSDIMIAEYAWTYLSRILKKNRAEYIKSLPDYMPSGKKTSKGDIYAMGWCAGIRAELKTLCRTMDEDEYLTKRENNLKYLAALHGKLEESEPAKEIPLNNLGKMEIDAFYSGAKKAENVKISRAVNAGQKQTLLESKLKKSKGVD